MSFQKIILILAIIILLISLVVIGITLGYSKSKININKAPVCPDYWTVDDSDPNNIKCTNTQNLGTCPATAGSSNLEMNFGVAPYIGANGNCSKYTWATNCGISWDGITYGVPNPCSIKTA